MNHFRLLLASLAFSSLALAAPRFSISFPKDRSATPVDGRILLCLSTDPSDEPRNQINDTPRSQIVFGMNVSALNPGEPVMIDEHAFGYPIRSLSDLPPGEYYVQAVLNRYETFHLANGHTVKLHPDNGEGQHWNITPGNFYNKPEKLTVDQNSNISLSLDEEIPPIPAPKDTKYIRHVRIQSELLTKFWAVLCI